ncbi:MAG: glycine oxidase ThiO [Rhodothermales bacterium]|nr:glycine oxidase ThiO [Rhodothermales bacterium]
MTNGTPSDPIVIVGGGIIGLSIGWLLADAGRKVTILERDRAGRAASWQAAGMLAASAEIGFEELEVYKLSRESMLRWPAFADRLSSASGRDLDFRSEETLIVADDPDSAEALKRVYDFQMQHGLDMRWLTRPEALEIEPFLGPRITAAVVSPHDHQVDNRAVVEALVDVFRKAGGELKEHCEVAEIHAGAPAKVLTSEGDTIEAGCVILAAGAWSRQIGGIPSELRPKVRPVKGQMAELRVIPPFNLTHVIRGPHAYLAPKSDGRLLVGATSEEMGFDTDVTAGGIYQILEGAWETVPGIYDLPLVDVWAGLRPASQDHRPLLGEAGEGIIYATGHYRHGIMLAPITSEEIARLVLTGEHGPWIAPFAPSNAVSTH